MIVMEESSEKKSEVCPSRLKYLQIWGLLICALGSVSTRAEDGLSALWSPEGFSYECEGRVEFPESGMHKLASPALEKAFLPVSYSIRFHSRGELFRCEFILVNQFGEAVQDIRTGYDGSEYYILWNKDQRLGTIKDLKKAHEGAMFIYSPYDLFTFPFFRGGEGSGFVPARIPLFRDSSSILARLEVMPNLDSLEIGATKELEDGKYVWEFGGSGVFPGITNVSKEGELILSHEVTQWNTVPGGSSPVPKKMKLTEYFEGTPVRIITATVKSFTALDKEIDFSVPYAEAMIIYDSDADVLIDNRPRKVAE